MQPKNVKIAGGYFVTSPELNVNYYVPDSTSHEVVTCGAIVRGDKHRPNPWQYEVSKWYTPYGRFISKGIRYYRNGVPQYYTYVHEGHKSVVAESPIADVDSQQANALYNRCLSKLYEQIKSSDLNLAVSLGEAPETLKMIKAVVDSATNARRSLKRLIKGNGIAGASRKLSDAWLGYAYGVRPLVSDVRAMLNHLSSNPSVLDVTTKARASSRVSKTISDGGSFTTITDSRRCQISVTWSNSDYRMSELSRITSLFPPTLLWELTTLSFVVDWFVDVGSYLANLEASFGIGLSFKHGYVSESRLAELSEDTLWVNNEPVASYSLTPVYTQYRRQAENRRFKRVLLGSFPAPRLPTLKCSLGSEQLLSAAALMRSLLLAKY